MQQRQHEKWERLFIERVQYKKVVAVSGALAAFAQRVQSPGPKTAAAALPRFLICCMPPHVAGNVCSHVHGCL